MAVQGGFVIGTLASAILNLPDVINARRLFAAGCICGAAANAGLVGAPDARRAHCAAESRPASRSRGCTRPA